ncbi:DnaD domain protein [Gracilibacillus oryzae]|uniref:DnaD domain protein n=2 Tax=Gracilibacillus oryzae TaxID=1672701 RepID=A0A7C8GQR3_9BACI|nr:DnaD domain protein [Gracilibacillus oryzae]
MIFAVNKDYHQWQITPNTKWDEEQLNQLIHINIKRKTSSDSAREVRESRTPVTKHIRKTRTTLRKKVSNSRTPTFVKHLPQESPIPAAATDTASVKTSLKTIKNKDIKEYNNNDPYVELMHFYRNNLQKGSTESPYNGELIKQWYNEFGDELLWKALKIAAKREAKGVKYIEKILFNWREQGITTTEAVEQNEKRVHSTKQKRQSSRNNIMPDWYHVYRKKATHEKLEPSPEEKEKIAAESDRMLAEYLASQGQDM